MVTIDRTDLVATRKFFLQLNIWHELGDRQQQYYHQTKKTEPAKNEMT